MTPPNDLPSNPSDDDPLTFSASDLPADLFSASTSTLVFAAVGCTEEDEWTEADDWMLAEPEPPGPHMTFSWSFGGDATGEQDGPSGGTAFDGDDLPGLDFEIDGPG